MRRPLNVPAWLATGFFVVFGTITGLIGLEALLLWLHQAPITWYTECLSAAYPLAVTAGACLISAGVAALVAHFWWHTR